MEFTNYDIKKLFKSRARLDVTRRCFGNKVINNWNSLSDNRVKCKTVSSFKNKLLA